MLRACLFSMREQANANKVNSKELPAERISKQANKHIERAKQRRSKRWNKNARQIEIKLQPRRWMQPHLNVFYKRWELLI